MLPFAGLQLNAEHELKGGGVPSPEGLQLMLMCANLGMRLYTSMCMYGDAHVGMLVQAIVRVRCVHRMHVNECSRV